MIFDRVASGLVLALCFHAVDGSLLFGVTATDLSTFGRASRFSFSVCAAAVTFPAQTRNARGPIQTLRLPSSAALFQENDCEKITK